MRNLKKFLALVLAMMMAFSLMVTANAANEADNGTHQYPDGGNVTPEFAEAVDVLYGMGVMTGDSGNFYPERGVMRSEMAAVLYRLMTGDTNKLKNELYANIAAERFEDVNAGDWFAPYVGWCYDAGIMVGSNGYFRPWTNVSGYETEVMVLRAMGYGKNHEYTGAGWYVNASSDATIVGLLKDVMNTHYSSTLSANTRRDVVASIVFQAAQLPTVTWTPSLGYNKYQGVAIATGNNLLNPSLGETYFGLTCAYGVVVGNQATGEGENVTKIGFTDRPALGTQNNNLVGRGAYYYETDAVITPAGGGAPAVTAGNYTGTFTWKTDLDLFNHAVKVWFNYGSTKTYALYDKVVSTAVVTAADADLDVGLGAAAKSSTPGVANNHKAPKFTLQADNKALWNYSFGPMAPANYEADATAAGVHDSPVLKNADAATHPLYLLISNTAGNVLDVVIPLELTMTQITQANNTTDPLSVGVTTANGGNRYFGLALDVGAGTTKNYTNLAQANLVDDSETALGKKVAAIAITGTAGEQAANMTTPTGMAGAKSPLNSTFYYKLQENKQLKTATVIKVDYATQDVTLSDNSVLKQSIFAEATDGTFTTNIEGAPTSTTPLQAGREYTFTLDREGNYIYWSLPAVSRDFGYGTYIDFETKVASSEFRYPMVYVNTNGEMKQLDITSENGATMGYGQYSATTLNKRDFNGGGSNAGYVAGKYIGYELSTTGAITAINTRLTALAPNATGFYQGDGADFGAGKIIVNPTDVVVGAKSIPCGVAGVDLYLTENTQFYIVDGAGTENQKVTPIKGLAKLMEGCDSVTIDGNTALAAGTYLAANATPYEMFYFNINRFDYAQNYVGSAYEVTTLYLPKDCIDFEASVNSSLAFIGDSSSTLVSSIGNHATQYTFYKNGVGESYWIDGFISEANTAASVIDALGDNVFYNLVATSKKAADNGTIYTVQPLTSGTKLIGQYFTGTLAAPVASVALDAPGDYKATTYSQQVADISGTLFNVGKAGIKNLDTDTYPGIQDNNLTSLNNAGSLVDNTTVPVSCILNGDDATNRTVDFIYVNA